MAAFGFWGVVALFWKEHFRITYISCLDNNWGSFLFSTVILFMPFFGWFVGSSLLSTITFVLEKPNDGWVLLQNTRQDIRSLQAADFYTVYAETKDGKLISCRYESVYDYDCWNDVSQISEIRKGDKCYDFPAPPFGINVEDRIDVEDCITFAGRLSISRSSYILSDNGQVYRNSYGSPSLIPPYQVIKRQALFSTAGLIVGLIIARKIMTANKKKNSLAITSG